MSDRKMNIHDLAAKVGWEGGILATLEYGITADDIEDSPVKDVWERMERHYGAIREDMHSIDLMLRQARRDRAQEQDTASVLGYVTSQPELTETPHDPEDRESDRGGRV